MVWAVTDKFKHYIIGTKYTVVTDNSAVACIMKKTVNSLRAEMGRSTSTILN